MASRGPSLVTGLVIAASTTLTWLLDDEDDPRAGAAIEILRREGGIAPQHWHYEIRNGLIVAVRRKRLSREDLVERLRSIAEFPVTTDVDSNLDIALGLAFEHNLTFYDSLYLELALRRQLALATLDHELEQAAHSAGIEVVSA